MRVSAKLANCLCSDCPSLSPTISAKARALPPGVSWRIPDEARKVTSSEAAWRGRVAGLGPQRKKLDLRQGPLYTYLCKYLDPEGGVSAGLARTWVGHGFPEGGWGGSFSPLSGRPQRPPRCPKPHRRRRSSSLGSWIDWAPTKTPEGFMATLEAAITLSSLPTQEVTDADPPRLPEAQSERA